MPFYLYTLTAPNGKVYAGISKDVKARWYSHKRKAREGAGRHPLYDSLRKYGHAAFRVEVILEVESLERAKEVEVAFISASRLTERDFGLNISRGGEYDCMDGPRVFWERMKNEPEAFEAYRARLSQALLKAAREGRIPRPEHLIKMNRALSPKERYLRQRRATRVAAKTTTKRTGKTNCGYPDKTRATWAAQPPSFKKRHAMRCKQRAKKQWAERSKEQRAEISSKISASVSTLSNDPAYRKTNLAGLAKGRRNMDRAKQGAAASQGLKDFWDRLRKDPERYAEYMKRRTATLLKTVGSKR